MRKKRRNWFKDNHHLVPRSRGGHCGHRNLLCLWRPKHDAIHSLFGNMTADEILDFLRNLVKRKNKTTFPARPEWITLFGKRSPSEAVKLWDRMQCAKLHQDQGVEHPRFTGAGRYARKV